MATLVHIANEKNKKNIITSGIKTNYNIVYFMPHMQDRLISHQWARELKRSGTKNFIAVDFKLNGNEEVWFGYFNRVHEKMELSKAIKIFMELDDMLGYEFL